MKTLIAIVLIMAMAGPVQAQQLIGEAQLRHNLHTISQLAKDSKGRLIIANYLQTLNDIKPVVEPTLKVAKEKSFTLDLWLVTSTSGSPKLPGRYDYIIQMPGTKNLELGPSDVYFDTEPIVKLIAWLESPAVVRQRTIALDRQLALQHLREVRTSSVILIALVKMALENKDRVLIVSQVEEMPRFLDIMNQFGLTSVTIVQKLASPPKPAKRPPKERHRRSEA